jgi:phosphoglycan beta-1,3-galactosyltransferase
VELMRSTAVVSFEPTAAVATQHDSQLHLAVGPDRAKAGGPSTPLSSSVLPEVTAAAQLPPTRAAPSSSSLSVVATPSTDPIGVRRGVARDDTSRHTSPRLRRNAGGGGSRRASPHVALGTSMRETACGGRGFAAPLVAPPAASVYVHLAEQQQLQQEQIRCACAEASVVRCGPSTAATDAREGEVTRPNVNSRVCATADETLSDVVATSSGVALSNTPHTSAFAAASSSRPLPVHSTPTAATHRSVDHPQPLQRQPLLPPRVPSQPLSPKPLVKSGTLSYQLYRLLRLCFLRRWTWQMWCTCVHVCSHRRRITRSGADDDADGHVDVDDEGATSGDATGEWRDGEEWGVNYGNEADSLDDRTLPSAETTMDLLYRATHDAVEDRERSSGNGGGDAGSRMSLMGETRRRGHGFSVPLRGGPGRRDRRPRSRHASPASGHGGNVLNTGSYARGTSLVHGWSLAGGCQLFCMFFFCCCCCPGGPLYCGKGRQARLFHPLRVLWVRYRTVVWCLIAALLFLSYFVVLPLLTACVVALLENESVFVQRMVFLGLPREVDPLTAPTTVVVQLLVVPPTKVEEAQKARKAAATADAAKIIAAARTSAASVAQQSLHVSLAQRHLPFGIAALLPRSFRVLQPSQLPSWTLYPITKGCEVCIDEDAYVAAVRGAPSIVGTTVFAPAQPASPPPHQQKLRTAVSPPALATQLGVYATTSAPLGRIGPMLLAIASVTDDVALPAEFAKWSWIPHVSRHGELLEQARRGAAPAHLAVLGIPSTDHPARASLRDAQRDTWMTYSDVARAENGFAGKLLVLYVFAASERRQMRSSPQHLHSSNVAPTAAAAAVKKEKQKASSLTVEPLTGYVSRDTQRLRCDASVLLPTLSEFIEAAEVRAVTALLPTGLDNAQDRAVQPSLHYVQRRMTLRVGWQQGNSADAPCDNIAESRVTLEGLVNSHGTGNQTPSATVALAAHLELPVAPLFTVPAQLVCYASAGLWQEALTYKNALWIDMMTDRQPTGSRKKMGEQASWGLPIEVGMSQKLILWLSYAYHAFPDVPYIIKGDDDTYLKVPQYLNDISYLQRGRSGRSLDDLLGRDGVVGAAAEGGDGRGGLTSTARHTVAAGRVPTPTTNYLRVRATEECAYWGSMRRWNSEVYFGAGMLFLLHRRLVQTVLEERPEFNNDVMRLVVQDYSPLYAHSYYAAMMDHEDVMLGKLLAERRALAVQLCPFHRSWYVWENWDRFHDVHRGRVRSVTWATVAAHRCTPVDFAYLHYFFQHEYHHHHHGGARDDAVAANEEAQRQAQAWVDAQRALHDATRGADPNGTAVQEGGNRASNGVRRRRDGQPAFDADTIAWTDLPEVLWTELPESNHTPLPYVRSAKDGVAVYEVEYTPFADGYLVLDGWVSNTQWRSERR